MATALGRTSLSLKSVLLELPYDIICCEAKLRKCKIIRMAPDTGPQIDYEVTFPLGGCPQLGEGKVGWISEAPSLFVQCVYSTTVLRDPGIAHNLVYASCCCYCYFHY